MVSHDILTPAHRVALAYAPVHLRSAWTALLALDVRMAGIVRSVREPMLAQIRLAWWRDTLARPAGEWPDGEPLLRELAAHLPGEAQQLAELPSAWEHLLADGPIDRDRLGDYVAIRSASYGGIRLFHAHHVDERAVGLAATWWVLGDTLARLSRPDERALLLEIAEATDTQHARLPRTWRPLAVLAALGRRAIKCDQPVMEGRAGALVALRAGLIGQ